MSEEKKIETALPVEKPVCVPAEKPEAGLPAEKAEAGLPAEKPAAGLPVEAEALPVEEEVSVAEGTIAEADAVEEVEIGEEPAFDAPEAEMEVDIRDDRDEEADEYIHWAAARAAAIVAAPLIGTMTLIANEVYMISKIGKVYGVKLADKAALAFIASLGATVTGSLAATLIPIPVMQLPIAVGVTYGVGKAAKKWIKDGMPDDTEPYLAVFEKEKEKGEEQVDEIKEDPRKDEPLGDETVKPETPETGKKVYPEAAHEAFGKFSGKLADAAGLASEKFLAALKKAGVTDEQLERAKYMAIGVSEVAKETAEEAAKDFHGKLAEKSKDWSAQAKEKSKTLSEQAKEKGKDLHEKAKVQAGVLKEKGKVLRRQADIRAAEAQVEAEKAKAEARIRMAEVRVKATAARVEAETRSEEAKVKAQELSAKARELAKEYKENAVRAAAEAQKSFRGAADDFKAKAMERAAQRRAEHGAAAGGAAPAGDEAAPCEESAPVEPADVEKTE